MADNITAMQFSAKYRSKNEIFRFLSSECEVYFSSYATVTIFHLKDICAGKRRIIKAKDVKYINVPQFDGLSTEDMLKFAEDYPEVAKAHSAGAQRGHEAAARLRSQRVLHLDRRPFQGVDGQRHGSDETQDRAGAKPANRDGSGNQEDLPSQHGRLREQRHIKSPHEGKLNFI